ncbi:MAG: hypothetical protein A2018_05165 [Alphaproteobacteria bacterium GWF2_58_20]|nr:MAG: hypothetical protein A2018_05165 [Alphaproteobacteria bacterium GWF2_58_20]
MADMGATVQKSYDVLRNGRGEICIIIDHRPSSPETPSILFSGPDAALERRPDETVFLPAFPEHFLETAKTCDSILVVEVTDISPEELSGTKDLPKNHISRIYDAKVSHE